jgi:hypothetical protein
VGTLFKTLTAEDSFLYPLEGYAEDSFQYPLEGYAEERQEQKKHSKVETRYR